MDTDRLDGPLAYAQPLPVLLPGGALRRRMHHLLPDLHCAAPDAPPVPQWVGGRNRRALPKRLDPGQALAEAVRQAVD